MRTALCVGVLALFAAPVLSQSMSQPATRVSPPTSGAERRAASARERQVFLNKPMTLHGATHDGIEFSTAALKGKVVLVAFWASWCPDCAKETPRIVAAYKAYKDKGLEVVGVSSDVSAGDLKEFLATRPDMAWPQLYTRPDASGRHPLNAEMKVAWIPTVFLIDRKGVCRNVDADPEALDRLLPPLLEEPGDPPTR